MRIKDSPKSNAEGSSKKESKKKNNKQKAEGNGSVTGNKNEKTASATVKADKEGKRPPTKEVPEQQVKINSKMSNRFRKMPIKSKQLHFLFRNIYSF